MDTAGSNQRVRNHYAHASVDVDYDEEFVGLKLRAVGQLHCVVIIHDDLEVGSRGGSRSFLNMAFLDLKKRRATLKASPIKICRPH